MSTQLGVAEIEYPESDGRPMGETDLHRDWVVRLIDLLQHRYRSRQVYVSGDLLVYYEQGRTDRFVVPDVFVVTNCAPGRRRTYKTWEEGKPPEVVIEVTSRSTKREDTKTKPQRYEQIGVLEYFLYDPTGDYLEERLAGFRLIDSRHQPIVAEADGSLECRHLGIRLRVVDGALVLRDLQTGQHLQTAFEEADEKRESAELQRQASEQGRLAAEAKALELEAELQRLRSQINPA